MKRAAFKTIQKMFPNDELEESLMEGLKPAELKELIDAHHKFQEAKPEMDSKLKMIKK
jgi:predicted urease superfamily metal-dependent hydrolase